MTEGSRLSAFGLEIEADFALPGMHPPSQSSLEASLALRLVEQSELAPLGGEKRILRHLHVFDDCPYAMLEGSAGDMFIRYGRRALFHLSADRRLLRCAPAARDDPTWQRVLLDTVLWTVSLLRGFELLHASAIGTPRGVVAFVAISGGGKTSLAAEWLRRGSSLFCDDILALEDSNGEVVGHPGPPLLNLPGELAPDSVGDAQVIAELGDEQWVAVNAPSAVPQPLAAVVLIERAAGREARCSPVVGTTLTLLPHAVGLTHVAERPERRFQLFGKVVATTPVLSLTADPSVPTSALADLIEDELAAQ